MHGTKTANLKSSKLLLIEKVYLISYRHSILGAVCKTAYFKINKNFRITRTFMFRGHELLIKIQLIC